MLSEVLKDWLFVESWMLMKVSRVKTSLSRLASQVLVDWWFLTANSITQVPRVSCILQQCDKFCLDKYIMYTYLLLWCHEVCLSLGDILWSFWSTWRCFQLHVFRLSEYISEELPSSVWPPVVQHSKIWNWRTLKCAWYLIVEGYVSMGSDLVPSVELELLKMFIRIIHIEFVSTFLCQYLGPSQRGGLF